MNLSETSFRVRALIQRFSEYKSTNLFILDLPEAVSILPSCRDVMQAVLHLQISGDEIKNRARAIERVPGASEAVRRIPCTVVSGSGLVEVSAEEATSACPPANRKIQVMASDAAVLATVRQALADDRDLVECSGTLQATAKRHRSFRAPTRNSCSHAFLG